MKEIKIRIHSIVVILLGLISFWGKAQNPDFDWKNNFDYLGEFHGDCAIFRAKESDGGNLGLIHRSGKIILPPEYVQMTWKTPTLVEVIKNNGNGSKSGLFNHLGQQILEVKFESIGNFSRGIAIITSDQYLKGIINQEGKHLVPIKYSQIEQKENHPYLVLSWKNTDETNCAIYIDTLGKSVGIQVFEEANLFDMGVAVVKVKGKYGLVNQQLQFIIPPKFSSIAFWEFGLLKLEKEGNYGISQSDGKEIIPCQYLACQILKPNRFLVVQKNGKAGVLNAQKKWIIPPIYDRRIGFMEGMKMDTEAYLVSKNKKVGMVGSQGQILVPLEYEEIVEAEYDPTHSYGLMVKKNGYWGMINRNGKEITTPIYDAYSYEFDGHGACQLVLVQKNNLWGCLDTKTGQEVVPTNFSLLRFIETKGEAEDSTLIFHINHFKAGKGIKLDTVYSYDDMYQRVETGMWEFVQEKENENGQVYFILKGAREWTILNRSGQIIYDRPFSNMRMYFNEGLLPFERNGRWGFIDSLGKEVIPPQFEPPKGRIQDYFFEGKAWVTKSGESYYINPKGEKIENQDD